MTGFTGAYIEEKRLVSAFGDAYSKYQKQVLKEKGSSRSIIALALSISGVVMIVQPQTLNNGNSISGVALGLASGLLYGLMIITSRSLKDNYTGIAQATWSMIVSLIIFSPFAFAISADGLKNDMHLLILLGAGILSREDKSKNGSSAGLQFH